MKLSGEIMTQKALPSILLHKSEVIHRDIVYLKMLQSENIC